MSKKLDLENYMRDLKLSRRKMLLGMGGLGMGTLLSKAKLAEAFGLTGSLVGVGDTWIAGGGADNPLAVAQNKAGTAEDSTTVLTASGTYATGSTVIVIVGGNHWEAFTVSGVSDPTNGAYTAATPLAQSGVISARMYYKQNITGFTGQITGTLSTDASVSDIIAIEVTGIENAAACLDDNDIGTGYGAAVATTSITTTVAKTIVVGGVHAGQATYNDTTMLILGSAEDGFVDESNSTVINTALWWRILTGTASGTAAITLPADDDWVACVAAFKDVGP